MNALTLPHKPTGQSMVTSNGQQVKMLISEKGGGPPGTGEPGFKIHAFSLPALSWVSQGRLLELERDAQSFLAHLSLCRH